MLLKHPFSIEKIVKSKVYCVIKFRNSFLKYKSINKENQAIHLNQNAEMTTPDIKLSKQCKGTKFSLKKNGYLGSCHPRYIVSK